MGDDRVTLITLLILIFRSPSDYRSLDCDSLSVDDGGSEGETNVSTTVIQIGGDTDHIPSIDDDEEEEGVSYNRRTLQTEVRRIEALMNHEINPSIFSSSDGGLHFLHFTLLCSP